MDHLSGGEEVSTSPARPAEDDPALRPIRLRNRSGLEAEILPFGATLARLRAPDRHGRLGDVILTLAAFTDYRGRHPHVGASVGRYANRIGGARFLLDGARYELAANDGPHHLHGGTDGFDRRRWCEEQRFSVSGGAGVRLRLCSPAGEAGYPGALDVEVRYVLGGDDTLSIEYRAVTDAPTVVSLTNHAYFHLDDGGASSVLDHVLWLAATHYTPVDRSGLPTGTIAPVRGSPFDFTAPHTLGERIAALVPERGGYDHNFALDSAGDLGVLAARLEGPRSGRVLEVRTTQPGLQLYTGNSLDGTLRCRDGVRPERWHAVCLETQSFPNAPNEPGFPPARLDPGESYRQTTVYSLDTR
ncbi:galactose mutarotase [Myxococcota bacterium]|nr:galactose mutarotase [Myxococcota bacterium]MCZ7617967.1 galactose mutarotase [Myxococcota bacterium]